MGSGFNFFTDAIDVSPTTTGQWVDVNVSAYIPNGSTGVILKILNTSTSATFRAEVRKKGSTDDFLLSLFYGHGRYVLVGVDGNRVFQACIANTAVKIYLVGYTDDAVGLFTNLVDVSPTTTGSWVDIDASSYIPSDATGVICLLFSTNTTVAEFSVGIRKNGSTNEFTYGSVFRAKNAYSYQLCGVDENRIFEAKIQGTTEKVYLVGYTKPPITFFANGIDVSLSTTGQWIDIDATEHTESTADGIIIFIKNTATAQDYAGDIRKNGSTTNHTANMKLRRTGCAAGLCGMDSEQIFEGYIAHTAVDFYIIGYCKPEVVGQTYEIYVDAVSQSLATPAYETTYNISNDASITSQSLHAQETTFNLLKDAITQALSTLQTETTFNINKDAIVQTLAEVLVELIHAGIYEIFFDASVQASATPSLQQILGINKEALAFSVSTPLIQSLFNISPEATVKVLAEFTLIKPTEVKITKLFLIIGDLAIQIQGG